jgi:SAM-dependent methyltransferase
MTIAAAEWTAAQRAERAYWCPTDADAWIMRRAAEREQLALYAGLLGITPDTVAGRSVLDLGCGPAGLTLSYAPHLARTVAVDPLMFAAEDEARYVRAGVARVVEPAETFRAPNGERFDEAWLYNVLQHVMEPERVIRTAQAHADTVRLFEWLNVPASVVHPHVLTAPRLDAAFAGWRQVRRVEGTARASGWTQQFLAVVYARGPA